MRTFLHLFIGLMIPLSGLFMVAATFYFKLDYSFTKAMRLGVLSGFFVALAVSFVTAIFLSIMRAGKQVPINTKKKKRKSISETHEKPIPAASGKVSSTKSSTEEKSETEVSATPLKAPTFKSMLLMDKEVAREITIYSIEAQTIGTITNLEKAEEILHVQTGDELMHIRISSLTKHTTQVSIAAKPDSQHAQKILDYLKEKEYSFLHY